MKIYKIIILSMLLISSAIHAQKVGVTAALKGEVLRLASDNAEASIGKLDSGDALYLGDDIKVSKGGRLQVLLLDETVFTLGSDSQMVIDTFVYNPDQNTGKLIANITKGAFRFVSGKVAKQNQDAMKVKLPTGLIGVRGTQVAGIVGEDGSSQIILVGPGINALGEAIGAITLTNSFGSVEIKRPGYMTIINNTAPPTQPVQATPEQIKGIEDQTLESAESALANELDINSVEIVLGSDEEGDGYLTIVANTDLGEIISNATKDYQASDNRSILEAVYMAFVGDQPKSVVDAGLLGTSIGGGTAEFFVNGSRWLDLANLSELLNPSLTGSSTFTANNVPVVCTNSSTSGCGGSYNVTDTWNFASDTYRSQVSTSTGGIKLDTNDNGALNVTLNFTIDKTTSFTDSFVTETGASQNAIVIHSQELLAADMTNVAHTGSNQTLLQVGSRTGVNTDPSITNIFNANTSTTTSAPASNLVVSSFGKIDNFELGGVAYTANIASHQLNILSKGGHPLIPTLGKGLVLGMEKQ
jgi:hypothetical protein